jgi:hypothetical protein
LDAFKTIRQGREGDEMYCAWDESLLKSINNLTVPLTLQDEKKKSAFTSSNLGLRNFYPWYLSKYNSAKNSDFIMMMLEVFEGMDDALKKKQYIFLRGDCNVFKMWIKVNQFFSYCTHLIMSLVHVRETSYFFTKTSHNMSYLGTFPCV